MTTLEVDDNTILHLVLPVFLDVLHKISDLLFVVLFFGLFKVCICTRIAREGTSHTFYLPHTCHCGLDVVSALQGTPDCDGPVINLQNVLVFRLYFRFKFF